MSEVRQVVIKNWHSFQHYKNRCPPWIKLHRSLLENREWHELPDSAARLLPELWILAAEGESGVIEKQNGSLAWRLRKDARKFAKDLKVLADAGFIELR